MTRKPQTPPADLFDYEPHSHAHRGDPDTSHIAAMQAGSMAQRHAAIVLAHLTGKGPSTSDEIAAAAGFMPIQIMKRVTDLRQSGMIEDSGNRRKGDSGRMQIVWQVVLGPEDSGQKSEVRKEST